MFATPAKNLAEGAAAIAKGKSVGAKTQRERDYIDALRQSFTRTTTKSVIVTRTQAYAKAMEQVGAALPE